MHEEDASYGSVRSSITDQGNVLLYVGTVGQIGENGIHVLDISDGDGQVGKSGERSHFVLILIETETKAFIYLSVLGLC